MIYNFFQFFVKIAHRFYFRTIYFLNEEVIPAHQPIIIAANHSNSALDALLISGLYKRKDLYWLARGDVFDNKWIAKLMVSVKTAPIYRASEVGFVDLKRNNDSFKICFNLLKENKMVGIFPEGITIHERKLQTPFKKGAARLAFQAHEELKRPIMIVPVGVSYHSLTRLRTDVFVKFGEPFSTDMFYDEYEDNPNVALKNMTHYLEDRLKQEVINYDQIKDQIGLKRAIEDKKRDLKLNEPIDFGLSRNPEVFNLELETVNSFIENEKNFLSSDAISSKVHFGRNGAKSYTFASIFYNIFILIARILYFLPNKFSKLIIKAKIKKPAFWGTVRFLLLFFLFPIYLIGLGILGTFFSGYSFFFSLIIIPAIVFVGLRSKNLLSNLRAK